jgi:hypothetical protein
MVKDFECCLLTIYRKDTRSYCPPDKRIREMVRDQNIIVGRNQALDSQSERRSRVVMSLHAMLRFFEPGLNLGLMLEQI